MKLLPPLRRSILLFPFNIDRNLGAHYANHVHVWISTNDVGTLHHHLFEKNCTWRNR
jgi:hypothetical protein